MTQKQNNISETVRLDLWFDAAGNVVEREAGSGDPYYQDEHATFYLGDCREVLRTLPEASVQTVITSPPYFSLRDYGITPSVWGGDATCEHDWGQERRVTMSPHHLDESSASVRGGGHKKAVIDTTSGAFCTLCDAWLGTLGNEPTPELFVQHIVEVFREVKRVLRPDGTLFLVLGDSFSGSGGAGGDYNEGGLRAGQPTYAGTGKVQKSGRANPGMSKIDDRGGSRDGLGSVQGLKPKDLVGIPWLVAFALRADGWWLRSDIIWSKTAPMPESVLDRPTRSHEYIFLLTKQQHYFYDSYAIREPQISGHASGNGFKRAERLSYADENGARRSDDSWQPSASGRNSRDVWTFGPDATSAAHFAAFPRALVERCVKAGSSEYGACSSCGAPYVRQIEKESATPWELRKAKGATGGSKERGYKHGDGMSHDLYVQVRSVGWQQSCRCADASPVPCVVIDPFSGSGTTVTVAAGLGRRGIGIDCKAEYLSMGIVRLRGKGGRL